MGVPENRRPETPRQLVVMRHAKAEAHGPTDFDRHLADRGVTEAEMAGRWLVGQGFVPDHVLVSAALRTRETWAAVADAAGWDADAIETDESETLYEAGPETALDLVREVPEDALALLVIGHNPTMGYLAELLDDGDGDEEASNALVLGYPTSAMTLYDLTGDWADLDEQGATIRAHHVPRA